MNSEMHHIQNILEFLRGKTIIDKIIVIRTNEIKHNEIFEFTFLDYVNWRYHENIKNYITDKKNFKRIEIIVHKLFSEKDKIFKISFIPNSIIFDGAENIEDTLLLDLKRYLESNRIKYEVNTNGIN